MSRCDTQEWRLWDRDVEAAGCCVMVRLRGSKIDAKLRSDLWARGGVESGLCRRLDHHYA
jgi:hypothetical protein